VDLILRLINRCAKLRILEPFCGTGRILIPLAKHGHFVVGIDNADAMLSAAIAKCTVLDGSVQSQIQLTHADVASSAWPRGFDLVVLGCNCLYEMATAEEQERCIQSASESVRSGGHVYVDNDHMEGDLAPSWQTPGVTGCFPTGLCSDGTRLASTWETVWFDVHKRLVKLRRCTRIERTDGTTESAEHIQQKHPMSKDEVGGWLERNGFVIESLFGSRQGSPYHADSGRAIFWARKR
jgi:SAM-dependent methyltransferase